MSFAKRNTLPKFTFQTPTTHEFCKLSDLAIQDAEDQVEDRVYILRSLILNDQGDYGDVFVGVTDDHKINLPGHLTRMLKTITRSERDVAEINAGKVGFKIEPYENEHGTHFTIKWVDVNPPQPAPEHKAPEVDI